MAKNKQQIIDEITAHIEKRGGAYPDWYVGIGTEARDLLFSDHKVQKKGDRWIHRRATSAKEACEVKDYFVSTLAADGPRGKADADADAVYAYKKTSHTEP